MLKYQELKEMDDKTLQHKLGELRRELFELKMEKHMKKEAGGIKKPHELKLKRRDAAKILTALNAKR